MNEKVKNSIDFVAKNTAKNAENLSSTRIKKADYDKTLIGFVSEKIVPENPKDDNDYKWRIQTNGVAYDIKPSACNITSVGQRVRLYVPNHSLKDKYAEVIENDTIICKKLMINNDKVVFTYSNDISEEVTLNRDEKKRITSFLVNGHKVEVDWNDDQ